jgi:hypothetical protein
MANNAQVAGVVSCQPGCGRRTEAHACVCCQASDGELAMSTCEPQHSGALFLHSIELHTVPGPSTAPCCTAGAASRCRQTPAGPQRTPAQAAAQNQPSLQEKQEER